MQYGKFLLGVADVDVERRGLAVARKCGVAPFSVEVVAVKHEAVVDGRALSAVSCGGVAVVEVAGAHVGAVEN